MKKTRIKVVKILDPISDEYVTISFDEALLALAFAILWPNEKEPEKHVTIRRKIEEFLSDSKRRRRYKELLDSGEVGRSRAVHELIFGAIAYQFGKKTQGRYGEVFRRLTKKI